MLQESLVRALLKNELSADEFQTLLQRLNSHERMALLERLDDVLYGSQNSPQPAGVGLRY